MPRPRHKLESPSMWDRGVPYQGNWIPFTGTETLTVISWNTHIHIWSFVFVASSPQLFFWRHDISSIAGGAFIDICPQLWWKLDKISAVVSVFLVLSSSFWCTSWHTWETCAMALLCSSSVRNVDIVAGRMFVFLLHTWLPPPFLPSRCDCCIFSATFLQTTSGNYSLHQPISWCLTSITACIFLWQLWHYRRRWMASLQKSRPRLTTSRTCEYGAILWHNAANGNTPLLFFLVKRSTLDTLS